ncbi:MAG: SOS response-associated peptidase [Bacteroidales bacterium]
MCFHSKQSKKAQALENRFKAEFIDIDIYIPTEHYNGFSHPQTPVITNTAKNKIQLFHWGLLPDWATDISFRKNTLNAKIETIKEKPSFRNSIFKRCLVLADGFYEWQWLDEKGKNKQKYLITMPDDEAFAMAGLWNSWTNQQTGEIMNTYTILTTVANEAMSIIHNSKKRMPMILKPEEETVWLNNKEIDFKREIELSFNKQ